MNQTVLIPHQLHRKLLGEKHVNIEDIESKTNSRITFPACESGSDVVTIYGPEQQIENAQSRLLVHHCVSPSYRFLPGSLGPSSVRGRSDIPP